MSAFLYASPTLSSLSLTCSDCYMAGSVNMRSKENMGKQRKNVGTHRKERKILGNSGRASGFAALRAMIPIF